MEKLPWRPSDRKKREERREKLQSFETNDVAREREREREREMSGLEQDGGRQDDPHEQQEEEVFMPEDEGTVVADLEGQASDDEEDEEDENLETNLNEDMDMAVDMDEEFAVERNDACACLETGLENGSGAAAGSSSADNSSAEAVAAEAAKASQRKPVYAVKWNKMDPSIVSCGGEDDRVRLWKPFHTEGPNSITLHGHQDSVVALDFDSTGKVCNSSTSSLSLSLSLSLCFPTKSENGFILFDLFVVGSLPV